MASAFLILSYLIAQFLLRIFVLHFSTDPVILFFLLWIFVMISLILILYLVKRIFEILLTSTIGSYIFIRGFSFIFGGFPEEEYLSNLIYYKEFFQLDRIITGTAIRYFLAIAVTFIISVLIQLFYTFAKNSSSNNNSKETRTKSKSKSNRTNGKNLMKK